MGNNFAKYLQKYEIYHGYEEKICSEKYIETIEDCMHAVYFSFQSKY